MVIGATVAYTYGFMKGAFATNHSGVVIEVGVFVGIMVVSCIQRRLRRQILPWQVH
jgi:hypothetical protein